jgi:hypothetical protein
MRLVVADPVAGFVLAFVVGWLLSHMHGGSRKQGHGSIALGSRCLKLSWPVGERYAAVKSDEALRRRRTPLVALPARDANLYLRFRNEVSRFYS